MEENTLSIHKEVEELRGMYSTTRKFNGIIAGVSGCGKTSLARTCVLPVHNDSFCPGGTDSISDMVEAGDVIADVRWEKEDPRDPKVFLEWEKVMDRRIKEGYFEHIGTYMLDEITTLSWAIMNAHLKRVGVRDMIPRTGGGKGQGSTNDYVPARIALELWIKRLINLPCNVIINGHLRFVDKEGEASKYVLNAIGQAVDNLPLLFSEFYTMTTTAHSKGIDRQFRTVPSGKYPARSRLSRKGLLQPVEEADIKSIMKKVGLPTEDKPKL